MIPADCPHVTRVRREWIYFCEPPITLLDATEGANAVVIFDCAGPAIVFDHVSNRAPIDWLQVFSCADHAVVMKNGEDVECFLFEHKSSLTRKKWLQAKLQLQGLYYNVLSALHLIGAPSITTVRAVITYTIENLVLAPDLANPILNKTLVGSATPVLDITDYINGTVSLDGPGMCQLIKVQRTQDTGVGVLAV